jgi:hypothetical protein
MYLRSNGVELDNVPMYGRFAEMHGFTLLPFGDQWAEASVCGLGGSLAAADTPSNVPKMGNPGQRLVHCHPQSARQSLQFRAIFTMPLYAVGARNVPETYRFRLVDRRSGLFSGLSDFEHSTAL